MIQSKLFDSDIPRVCGLSLWQPWASLVAIGAKRRETRSWKTPYRGFIAIHAAKKQDLPSLRLCQDRSFSTALSKAGYHKAVDLPFGCFVAIARLVEISPTDTVKPLLIRLSELDEIAFGDYSPGRYAWKFEDIQRLEMPIPARGYQGLWNLDQELIQKLFEAVEK